MVVPPHAVGVVFSPEHGLLAWTPLVAIALIGLVLLAALPGWTVPQAQRLGALLVLMCLAQIYTSGIVESWTVAGSFGQRRFVASLLSVLTIGVATILAVTTHVWFSCTVMTLLVLCVWWNVGLMAQFGMNRMDRQKLTLARNARLTFVEITPSRRPASPGTTSPTGRRSTNGRANSRAGQISGGTAGRLAPSGLPLPNAYLHPSAGPSRCVSARCGRRPEPVQTRDQAPA